MFCYNDALFMNENESLAFYTTTNTFNNPLFDAQCLPNETLSEPSSLIQEEIVKQSNEEKISNVQKLTLRRRCGSVCDSFVFSIKNKIYVVELNLRRRLQRLKSFATNRIRGWTFLQKNSKKKHQKYLSCDEEKIRSQFKEATIGKAQIGFSRKEEEEFWRNALPDSRKSLCVQQEKILSRLKQAVQAKRNNNQYLYDIGGEMGAQQRYVTPLQSCIKFERGPNAEQKVQSKDSNISSSSLTAKGRVGSVLWNTNERRALDATNFNALPSGDTKKLCIVCYTNEPNIVTIPCRHHDICSDCFIETIYIAVKQSQFPLKCVLCRQKIERIRCSKKLLLNVIEKNRIYP